MLLVDQAAARVALATEMGKTPLRWIVSEAAAVELAVDDDLHGLPVQRGVPRSDWGLELILATASA